MTRLIIVILLLSCTTYFSLAQQPGQSEHRNPEIDSLIFHGAFDAALLLVDGVLEEDSLDLSALLYRYQLYLKKNKSNSAYRTARDNYKYFKDKIDGVDQ